MLKCYLDSTLLEGSQFNMENPKLTFTRSETYRTVIRSFIPEVTFYSTAMDYVYNKTQTEGLNSEITFRVLKWSPFHMAFKEIYNGILNLQSLVIKEYSIKCDIVDNSFTNKIFKSENKKINYLSELDIYGNEMNSYFTPLNTITLKGVASDTTCQGVQIYRLLTRLIYAITGQNNKLKSVFFGREGQGSNLKDGEGCEYYITNGKYISNSGGTPDIVFSLKDLFTDLANIFNLGLYIEDYNNVQTVYINKMDTFYSPEVLLQVDNLSDWEMSLNSEMLFSSINVGYVNSTKVEANDLAGLEYNINVTYGTPINLFKTELSILSKLRADGTAIEFARTETIEEGNEGKYDKDNFILCCVNDEDLEVRTTEGYELLQGVGGETPIYINVDISPARILRNWCKEIAVQLDRVDSILQINSTGLNSLLESRKTGESYVTKDNVNINTASYDRPLLDKYIVKFTAPLTDVNVENIFENPNGLIKFYNILSKTYNFGWIKEVSINLVTNEAEFQLLKTIGNDFDDVEIMKWEHGLLLTEDNEQLILE